MKTLLCFSHPYLRIYNPTTGGYAEFIGGRLNIEEGDPNYGVVMAQAISNPAVTILEMGKNGTNCPECGAAFEGTAAAAHLGTHRKNLHFDEWVKDRNAASTTETATMLKERAGIACDVCAPAQVFADLDSLGAHIRLLHTAPGDEATVAAHRPGEVDPLKG